MSEPVVRARGLGKAYHIYRQPSDRLKQALLGRRRRYYREFWALRDIDLEIERGCATAIIGRNGSGKSTLLQLIAGTQTPSTGSVETSGGRIAALLELGSGFNPAFTGRENVYLNGAVLGLSRRYVDEHFERILDFSELRDFIDQPVKTYSSGMYVRLAFSVQVFAEPEVLIVDEALAVGDVFFQQKCFERLRRLREAGVTLLFVTHDTAAVQAFCDEAVLLEAGSMLFRGLPAECVTRYHALRSASSPPLAAPVPAVAPVGRAAGHGGADLPGAQAALHHDLLPTARSRHGTGDLEILSIHWLDEDGREARGVRVLSTLEIRVQVRARRPVARPAVGLHVYDRMGTLVFAAGTPQLGATLPGLQPGETLFVRLHLGCSLYPGRYTLSVVATEPSGDGPNTGHFHDVVEGLGPLDVAADPSHEMPFFGVAQLPLRVQWQCGRAPEREPATRDEAMQPGAGP